MSIFSASEPVLICLGPVNDIANAALELGLVERVEGLTGDDTGTSLAHASCVLLCGTDEQIRMQLPGLESRVAQGCLVIELARTKESLLEYADEILTLQFDYLSAQLFEMPGARANQAADRLFGTPVVLVPSMATRPESLERGQKLWSQLGCRVFQALPHEHDTLCAAFIQLPALLSDVYLKTIAAHFPDSGETERLCPPAIEIARANKTLSASCGSDLANNPHLTTLVASIDAQLRAEGVL